MDDQGDHWIFEFVPRGDALGGGARVSVAKADFRVLKGEIARDFAILNHDAEWIKIS